MQGGTMELRVRQDSGQLHFSSAPPQRRPRHAFLPRWHFDMVRIHASNPRLHQCADSNGCKQVPQRFAEILIIRRVMHCKRRTLFYLIAGQRNLGIEMRLRCPQTLELHMKSNVVAFFRFRIYEAKLPIWQALQTRVVLTECQCRTGSCNLHCF